MRVNYDAVAPHYDRHRSARGPHAARLAALASAAPGPWRLEIGAGTGNETQVMAQTPGPPIVALEASAGMIAQAAAKGAPAHWVRAKAPDLPVVDGACGFVYGVYVLHHFTTLRPLLNACLRALRSGGCAAFVTVSQEFIHAHPMNRYFPSFAKVDAARFQPVPEIETAMGAAGFARVASESNTDPPRPIDAAYFEKVAARFISTYALLPEDEFQDGLRRLRDDIGGPDGNAGSIARESTVVWGWRP